MKKREPYNGAVGPIPAEGTGPWVWYNRDEVGEQDGADLPREIFSQLRGDLFGCSFFCSYFSKRAAVSDLKRVLGKMVNDGD